MDKTLHEQNKLIIDEKKKQVTPNIKLKRERELRGWSQATLAKHIEAQAKLITRWETGVAFPSPYYRQKLCQVFEKNAEDLGLLRPRKKELAYNYDIEVYDDEPISERSFSSIGEVEQSSPPARIFSRRLFALSLIGGASVAIVGGGLWWSNTLAHNKVRVEVPIAHNTFITSYIYHTPDLKTVNDVAWSPRGGYIACAIGNKTVQILEAATGRTILVYQRHKGFVECAQWAYDGTRIASASSDQTVQVWNPINGVCNLVYQKHTKSVYYLAWSHSSKYVASGGADATVQVWDASTGESISIYRGHKGTVWSVRWSPDDRYIVSGGEDGTIHVWESAHGVPRATFFYKGLNVNAINEVDWSHDGTRIALASGNGLVTIWDAVTGDQVLTYPGHNALVRTARWSPDDQYIASGGADDAIHIWNAKTGKLLFIIEGLANDVLEVSWSPDGKNLACGSKDSTMRVCQLNF